jgi:hypothetical protein
MFQLSSHLKENARYLRALEQGYKEFQAGLDSGVIITLETIPSLHFLADKLDKYTNYLHKLLPYQLLRYTFDTYHHRIDLDLCYLLMICISY